MGFAKFMSSGMGRGSRIVVGLALIVIGLFSVGSTGGLLPADRLSVVDAGKTSADDNNRILIKEIDVRP